MGRALVGKHRRAGSAGGFNGVKLCRIDSARPAGCRLTVVSLSSHCRPTVVPLSSHCRLTVVSLSDYCRITVGLLSDYCRITVGLLSDYCQRLHSAS